MSSDDRRPIPNTPVTARIRSFANNRYGAVLSSLYSFWTARAAALANSNAARRDAYSLILFNKRVDTPIVNDLTSTPDRLLEVLLCFRTARHGTNFDLAIQQAQRVMEHNWNAERRVAGRDRIRQGSNEDASLSFPVETLRDR